MLAEEFNIEGTVVTVKKRLAEGGFGYIELVTENKSGSEYCLKRCGIQNNDSQNIVNLEIKMLQTFRCDNIVNIIGSDIKQVGRNKVSFILLEYCPGGHLLDMLNQRAGKLMSMSNISDLFSQVLKAVQVMHTHDPPVTHRDLKLENILMGRMGTVKLCDFGSCVMGNVTLTNALERSRAEEVIGKTTTQAYRAPEMVDLFMREVLTEKTDIWALGCILYTLCFLSHPFQDAGNLGILSGVVKMPTESAIPETATTLISRMLDMDPEARPSIAQVMAATTALSHGTSLPPFEISAEAKQHKAQREMAKQRRVELMTKQSNNKKCAPHRAPVQLDPNSAAARRLAAKRGTAQSTTIAATVNTTSSDDVNFGNFGDFDASTPSRKTEQDVGFATFETNFENFSVQDNTATSDQFFGNADDDNDNGGGVINNAPVTSSSADDMFFSEPAPAFGTGVSDVSSNQDDDDGFSNFNDSFDPNAIGASDGFISAAKETNIQSDDLFFSSPSLGIEEQSEENGGNSFEFSENSYSNDGFGQFDDNAVGGDAMRTNDVNFFEGTSTDVNPFDDSVGESVPTPATGFGHDSDGFNAFAPSEGVFQSHDIGSFDDPPQTQTQAPEVSFNPPQNDPFDMFSSSSVFTGGASSRSSAATAPASDNDLFSFTAGISSGEVLQPSPSATSIPSSKAANVMEMFSSGGTVDPFAHVQQQPQSHHHQQPQRYQQQHYQHPSGQGYPRQGNNNGGGVRQMNPAGKADPFGSLMGPLN